MTDWKEIQDHPVFIGGHRKSGTTMLVGLLDGHEELFVFPSESGFFYKFYPVFTDPKYSFAEKENRVVETILKTLDEVLRDWVGKGSCPGYSFEKLKGFFFERLRAGQKRTQDFFDAIYYAAWKTLSQGMEKQKYWVEKTTSIEIYANTLFEWYPKAKFIHLLRDPRDNYAAIKAGWEKNYKYQFDSKERLLQSVMDRAVLGMRLAEINEKRFGRDRYLTLRYEDLVTDPKATLIRVCEFLDISFLPSLLAPTFCGVPWKGNNYDMKKFDAISDSNVGRWKERINEHEAKVLEFYFKDLMAKYNYRLSYDPQDAADAAREHYKWFNFAQVYSLKIG